MIDCHRQILHVLVREPEAKGKASDGHGLLGPMAKAAAGMNTFFGLFGRPRTRPVLVAPTQAVTGTVAGARPTLDLEVGVAAAPPSL